MTEPMSVIAIHTDVIQLDQLLKWAAIADSGGQAKQMIDDGMVTVNQQVIFEKRKKIRPGDIIEIKGIGQWQVKLGE